MKALHCEPFGDSKVWQPAEALPRLSYSTTVVTLLQSYCRQSERVAPYWPVRLRGNTTTSERFCDGCGAQFSTEHGLNCKHGGLVNERHNATADEWIYLAGMAFQPSACSHKPMVNEGNPRGRGNGGAGAPVLALVFRARGTAGGNRTTNGGNGATNGGNRATNGGNSAAAASVPASNL